MKNLEKGNMINFTSIEDLVSHMYEKLDTENPASVIADKDLIIYIMMELLRDGESILDVCNIDVFEYDKEYMITLYEDTDSDHWHFSICQAYDYEKKKYLGTDGYVLFHEDVKSKALTDIKNNEFVEISGYDVFTIGEDEEEWSTLDNTSSVQKAYYVNGKKVDENTYKKAVESINHKENENWGYNYWDWVKFMKEALR